MLKRSMLPPLDLSTLLATARPSSSLEWRHWHQARASNHSRPSRISSHSPCRPFLCHTPFLCLCRRRPCHKSFETGPRLFQQEDCTCLHPCSGNPWDHGPYPCRCCMVVRLLSQRQSRRCRPLLDGLPPCSSSSPWVAFLHLCPCHLYRRRPAWRLLGLVAMPALVLVE